ncbi:DUF4062 domain-containing protein [Lentzea sp. BCCO 10_0856]|uniref:DUF4062 domain-containing protein n=1 Tax=Lentzea miocenica TaxID=3095431 RepID=A0ABU4SW08_9PSEU|nr:DUF4062 domain-containing protein [Lentzea sp. BCCO 10_0856]MDX8030081.1 DUF4062 domain-containing protein [Lentzea sp. BCCO 10_0856]
MSAPRQYPDVMVSSTFADLREHRAALMSALQGQEMFPVAMESDSALPAGTVLDSSLRKVREAAGYVGIVSHRYGQIPVCDANPDGMSLTHLEYREAVRLGRPILIFIMGDDHPVRVADIERDQVKQAKLDQFREEVKLADGELHRVYRVFTSLEDFTSGATQSVSELRRLLESEPASVTPSAPDGISAAPELYARPRYLGSHSFVGRQEQLTTLSEWASAAESRTVLLFEAIGGTGKSILTWEWINHYAPGVRDWAGRFWYSFYEAGAVMADFCQHALSYMTGRPLEEFTGEAQDELGEQLLRQLESKPWLLVLDGLERVLVAYHRYDAARLLDEEAGATDEIGDRHPCEAIRPEDEDLLRRLAAAAPSKILISSRLVPKVLLNHASQAIPGVLHQQLPGLRPADAEALLRACGVTGDSRAMRTYLQRHCDCHPLVTGIVAGLVSDYLPARGDFDEWAGDADAGGSLDVGELNLVQKRNHILRAAVSALPEPSRRLLCTLAILSEAVEYETLRAVSPLPSSAKLGRAVSDLEQRGLLQYDWSTRHYDLHPVVRAVSASTLRPTDLRILGQRVVDHFSVGAHGTYLHLRSVDELRSHITVVRTLLQMGKLHTAFGSYINGLGPALLFKLEAAPEALSLLRPFFEHGWTRAALVDKELTRLQRARLCNDAGAAFNKLGDHDQALALYQVAVEERLDYEDWSNSAISLTNVSIALHRQNRRARGHFVAELALQLAELSGIPGALFMAQLQFFVSLGALGDTDAAIAVWPALDLRRTWDVQGTNAGDAELAYAELMFDQGVHSDLRLDEIEAVGRLHGKRFVVRGARRLRGHLHLKRAEWAAAAAEFEAAVSSARHCGLPCSDDEGLRALARVHLGQLPDARAEVENLTSSHFVLAQLWQAIGDRERAIDHALAAHRFAWADGEPYVRRFVLDEVILMLKELEVAIPVLPPYDAAKDPQLPLEKRVEEVIAKLRAKKSR